MIYVMTLNMFVLPVFFFDKFSLVDNKESRKKKKRSKSRGWKVNGKV